MSNHFISNPPKDQISRVRFAPKPDEETLLAASWDGTVRVYNASGANDSLVTTLDSRDNESFPVLDACFTRSKNTIIAGGLSKALSFWDVQTGNEKKIGTHQDCISCLEYHIGTNQAFTGSWDSCLKSWDLRSQKETNSYIAESKIYSMDQQGDKVLLGLNNKKVLLFDTRNMSEPEEVRDTGLKYMLRDAKLFPDCKGFTCSSVEGRVSWEFFDQSDPANKPAKYAFKCHRENLDGKERIHPVNCLAFHPTHGTFATGGCDGVVSMWDGWAKKRLWRLGPYDTSISSLAFSGTGEKLAIAISYTFEQGEQIKEIPPKIIVRPINEADCQRKSK